MCSYPWSRGLKPSTWLWLDFRWCGHSIWRGYLHRWLRMQGQCAPVKHLQSFIWLCDVLFVLHFCKDLSNMNTKKKPLDLDRAKIQGTMKRLQSKIFSFIFFFLLLWMVIVFCFWILTRPAAAVSSDTPQRAKIPRFLLLFLLYFTLLTVLSLFFRINRDTFPGKQAPTMQIVGIAHWHCGPAWTTSKTTVLYHGFWLSRARPVLNPIQPVTSMFFTWGSGAHRKRGQENYWRSSVWRASEIGVLHQSFFHQFICIWMPPKQTALVRHRCAPNEGWALRSPEFVGWPVEGHRQTDWLIDWLTKSNSAPGNQNWSWKNWVGIGIYIVFLTDSQIVDSAILVGSCFHDRRSHNVSVTTSSRVSRCLLVRLLSSCFRIGILLLSSSWKIAQKRRISTRKRCSGDSRPVKGGRHALRRLS